LRLSHKCALSGAFKSQSSGLAQHFIAADREHVFLDAAEPAGVWLPAEHLAWFLLDAVAELDLAVFLWRLSRRWAWVAGA
jgi:hypothetical protein